MGSPGQQPTRDRSGLIYSLGPSWGQQGWPRIDGHSLSVSWTCQSWQDVSLGVWVSGGNSGSGRVAEHEETEVSSCGNTLGHD